MLGPAREEIFGGKEAGEVLPHDFMGLVAENALRPRIPAEQPSFKSYQEDGVLFRFRRQ